MHFYEDTDMNNLSVLSFIFCYLIKEECAFAVTEWKMGSWYSHCHGSNSL